MSALETPAQMAAARIAAALRDLEAAAVKLDNAEQALSAVNGFSGPYTEISDLRTRAFLVVGTMELALAAGCPIGLDHEPVTKDEAIRWGSGWIG